MKNKHFAVLGALIPLIGASLAGQTVLSSRPAIVYGQAHRPVRLGEMLLPPGSAPNRAKPDSLYTPNSVAVDSTLTPSPLYVADSSNNRVLGWRDSSAFQSGAPADIVIGQKDFTTTVKWGAAAKITEGPVSYNLQTLQEFPGGLWSPSSVAAKDNLLFVMDAGNNRVLRFPMPFEQFSQKSYIEADLVLGQADLYSNAGNRGSSPNNPTDSSIRTNGTGTGGIQAAAIALDVYGNLWLTDSGNHRILRYPATAVFGAGNASGDKNIAADFVLGQTDFTSATANAGRFMGADLVNKSKIRFGNSIAFDSSGNLFVADDLPRVLMWKPTFDAYGKPADRILGIVTLASGQTPPPVVNNITFGFTFTPSSTTAQNAVYGGGPRGLLCISDFLYVFDSFNNRVVRFDPAATWPLESAAFSPAMAAVFGQQDFNSRVPNGGETFEPSAAFFNFPVAGAYANGEVYIVDQGNNRVLVAPTSSDGTSIQAATRELGQLDFPFRSPNRIDGSSFREGAVPGTSVPIGPALAFDHTSSPPRLYIADTGNNRILCFADANRFDFGVSADIILGQVDESRALINSPLNDPRVATRLGLFQPAGLALDKDGNLWVADTGNGRVLRYPNPFNRVDGSQEPDLVLGQPDFDTRSDGKAARDRMFLPVGLAFTPEGNLAVSDLGFNRVVYYRQPSTNGQVPDLVLGQFDGSGVAPGKENTQLSAPRGVALDSFGRLLVADAGNARIQVWDDLNTIPSDGAPANFAIPTSVVGLPLNLAMDPRTDVIWLVDASNRSSVYRFPSYKQMSESSNFAPDFQIQTAGPRGVALDASGNPLIIDSASRITMHYPRLTVTNAANDFPRVAPAMIASLRIPGVSLTDSEGRAAGPQLPMDLGDLEILVDGVRSPLWAVSGETARMIVPKGTTPAGSAEFVVRKVSTGQVLGFDRVTMSSVSPGIIFQGDTPLKQGLARAYNQNGSPNSAASPAKAGEEITILLTGHGAFDGLPDDGMAPGSEVPVPGDLIAAFLVGTTSTALPATTVISSTLDPNEPGVWRVKLRVPDQPVASGYYTVTMAYRSVPMLIPPGSSTIQVRPIVYLSR